MQQVPQSQGPLPLLTLASPSVVLICSQVKIFISIHAKHGRLRQVRPQSGCSGGDAGGAAGGFVGDGGGGGGEGGCEGGIEGGGGCGGGVAGLGGDDGG